jgi:hypothetical protein
VATTAWADELERSIERQAEHAAIAERLARAARDPDPLVVCSVARQLQVVAIAIERAALVEARRRRISWERIAAGGGWASRQGAHARASRLGVVDEDRGRLH